MSGTNRGSLANERIAERRWVLLAGGAALAMLACGGGETADKDAPAAVTVSITSPSEGDTVRGTDVHIVLTASGIELAPAADAKPGTAHHHLYLDTDLGGMEMPIPSGTSGIVHLGKAETEFHWAGLAAGSHRIIAVLADPAHVPLQPLVADTVTFVVVP